MKIKLPTALRAALLTAMAGTVSTAYAVPYDPSSTTEPIPGIVQGLLVGEQTSKDLTISPSSLTVVGDIVAGAGDRSGITGGDGTIHFTSVQVNVTGNIYAGASGVASFPGYVTNAHGGDGVLDFQDSHLSVNGAIRLGWLNDKSGSMTLTGGTATVGGQIVLGYYNKVGGPSLGTEGNLTLQSGATLTASRELLVASGALSVQDKNTSIDSKSKLEIVGIEQSSVMITNEAKAVFDSILVGSCGASASLSIMNNGTLTSQTNFQLSAGHVFITNSDLIVKGDAWFGNQVPGATSPIDSYVIVSGATASFTSKTLSIWQDANIKLVNEATVSTETLQTAGTLSISSDSSLTTLAVELMEGSSTTLDSGFFETNYTKVSGEASLTADNVLEDELLFRETEIVAGGLHLDGSGFAKMDKLTIANGFLDSSITKLAINEAIIDKGSTLGVNAGSEVAIAYDLDLHGSLATAGTLHTKTLNLESTSQVTVSGSGSLGADYTTITNKVSLDNTGINGGSLGEMTFADNATLELNNNNTTSAIKTGKNNTINVSGSGNSLGEVTIGTDSTLSLKGDNQAATLVSAGRTDINGALTLTGTTLTLSQGSRTTISGSLTATQAAWNTNNAPVTLLINNNTQHNGTMLAVNSGVTGDAFNVAVDMSQGIAGISGKTVTFASNNGTAVEFTKTDTNFAILGDGRFDQKNDSTGTHVTITHTVGSTTTTYGYTITDGALNSGDSGWKGTGITFDEAYTSDFVVVDRDDTYLSMLTTQKNSETHMDAGTTYGKVDLASSSDGDTATNSIISKGITDTISVSSQDILLKDSSGNIISTIATGAKAWEVTDSTTITGTDAANSQIGGISSDISITDGDVTYAGETIAALNIADGKQLEIKNATTEIGQTLSMGNGAALSATNSAITIGGQDVTLKTGDVSYEVARLDANGKPIVGADGKYIMDTVTLSDGLRQKELQGISLNLEDSTMKFDTFDVKNDDGQIITTDDGKQIVFNSATVITKQSDKDAEMELGGGTAQLVFNNSSIAGTGTLNNVVMNGGSLKVGNSPGVLTVTEGSYNGTHVSFLIDPNNTTPGESHTITPGDDWKDAPVSQMTLTGNTVLSHIVVSVYMESLNAITGQYESIADPAAYARVFAEDTSFQLINGVEEHLAAGSSFTIGSLPTLQEGLVWDTSSLFTDGTIKVAKGTYSDPARIANTLVSAGETVSGFGQMARTHIYDVRLNGTNVWANGLGTFLNHSSHNGRTGFEYNAGGYAVGADTIVDNKAIVGFAFGQSFGKQTPKAASRFYDAGKIDMNSIMFGLYGGTSFNMKSPSDSMKLDAYASYGRFDNDSTHRSFATGSAANASWKENAYALGATLTRVHEVRENLYFSPFASLDYTYADMDSVNESSANGNIHYESTAYQNLSLSLGTGLTRVYHLDGGQELSPYVSVAYVGDLIRKDAKVTSRNATGVFAERSVSPGRNAFQVNVGTGWKVTQQWGMRLGYTAEFRSGATDQSVNVGVSYAF